MSDNTFPRLGARYELVRDVGGYKTLIATEGVVVIKVAMDGRITHVAAEALAERVVESLNRHKNQVLFPEE